MRSALAWGVLSMTCLALACSTKSDGARSDVDIIGGVEANGAKLNAIGAMGFKEGDTFDFFCTATLIAPDLVLTAKHCAREETPTGELLLDEGEVHFGIGPDSEKPIKTVKARAVVTSPIHEGGFVKYGSDVAIYVLAEPVTDVKPMRFARASLKPDAVGQIYTAVGYGVMDRQRKAGQRRAGAVTLRAVEGKPMQAMFESKDAFLSYLREKEGDEYIKRNQASLDEFWDFSLLDAYEAYLGLGKDDAQPCSGDSGGPLVHKAEDGELEVVAVVSGSFKGRKFPCSLLGEAYATFGPKVQELIGNAIACKDVPVEGRCEGTTAVRCVSDREGPQKVTRTDCGRVNQIWKLNAAAQATCDDEDPPPPPADAGAPDAAPSADAGSPPVMDAGAPD